MTLLHPLPAGPTDNQNITTSVWISVHFFSASLRAEPNLGPIIKFSLFIHSKAVSGGCLFKEKTQRPHIQINKWEFDSSFSMARVSLTLHVGISTNQKFLASFPKLKLATELYHCFC